MNLRKPTSRRSSHTPPPSTPDFHRARQRAIIECLGLAPHSYPRRDELPFSRLDVTAGTENELQVAVRGAADRVDLPRSIATSSYYQTLSEYAGHCPESARERDRVQRYLDAGADAYWEHSWVRMPRATLSPTARRRLDQTLAQRSDHERYRVRIQGEDGVRLPMSYVLPLALQDCLATSSDLPASVYRTGERLAQVYTNDNSSPELLSLFVVPTADGRRLGPAVVEENQFQFLLSQLLVEYANEKFGLHASGQSVSLYFAPTPGPRQRLLGASLPIDLYRELIVNPCLAGFDDGEAKRRYMHRCHESLTRSAEVAHERARAAGLTRRRLSPQAIDTGLLNNGTHLSLGSRRLAHFASDPQSGFGAHEEKYLGDLTIKIIEHFLPLFVGTYSAAPFRLRLSDLHAGRALRFLPLELHAVHLKMFWRQWKRKATGLHRQSHLRSLPHVFSLRGDFVQDYRLLDYFVALPSCDHAAGLDGVYDNDERLKAALDEQGVFHREMSLYLPYRLRDYSRRGFSGFEGRHYSVFEDLRRDLAPAAELQQLMTALAYHYLASGRYTHAEIPDDPFTESERRQLFFATAAGLPMCHVRKDTPNVLLRDILARAEQVRSSSRYPSFYEVPVAAYRVAALRLLREDAPAIVEDLDAQWLLDDLASRLADPYGQSAAGRLTRGILEEVGAGTPMEVGGSEFNQAADHFYRTTLRKRMLDAALAHTADALAQLESGAQRDPRVRGLLYRLCGNERPATRFTRLAGGLHVHDLDVNSLRSMIELLVLLIGETAQAADCGNDRSFQEEKDHASVY